MNPTDTGSGSGTAATTPTLPTRTVVILLKDGEPCRVIIATMADAIWTQPGILDLQQTPHTQIRTTP